MRIHKRWCVAAAACLSMVLLLGSCGKSKDKVEEKAKGKDEAASKDLVDIARRAQQGLSLEQEFASLHEAVQGAGFVTKHYDRFPSQELGKKGRVLIYTDKKAKKSGGVIYLKKTGNRIAPGWHWHFDDMVPQSVTAVEANDDGLWDVKLVTTRGEEYSWIQDESFTLMAKPRSDWIAMNGECSPPTSEDYAMWMCFDGDTVTAWQSSLGGGGSAYLEVAAPFGVQEGILIVQTLETHQPRKCTLYADGKKVQQFELESTAGKQIVRLESAAQGAKRIRLVFESAHGGDVVAVSELAFK